MIPSLISYATGCRMPYQTEREAHGIHQKFWGDLLPPELFDSLKAIPETPDFPSLRYIIKDYREVNTFDIGVKTLLEGLALNMHWKHINPHIVVAVVTTDPEVIDVCRTALTYPFDAYPRQVFSTLEDARAWIAGFEKE